MKKRVRVSTVIGIVILILFAAGIAFVGYRVVVQSDEKPGKLASVSVSADNLQYTLPQMSAVQKVDYDTMKYGYMDDVMLAQMNSVDAYYENVRMDEIRAVNDLTAMSSKTADMIAYQEAKKKQEEDEKKAQAAAAAAELARQAKIKELADAKMRELFGTTDDMSNQKIDTGDSSDTGSGSTKSNGGRKGEPVYASSHGKSLGKFVITAYCTCRVCCGVYSGGNRTASGTVPTSNRTLAVDTSVIKFKTKLVINGQVYVAEDRGGAIKGKRIDMFFYTHKEALRWGRRTMEVYLAD